MHEPEVPKGHDPPVRPAMSEDARTATVNALREMVGRPDIEQGLQTLLADDVRWAGSGPGGACRSRADVLRTIREQGAQGVQVRLRSVRSAGEHVLVELAVSRDGGHDTRWMLLTLDAAGRVTEMRDYSSRASADHDLALAAAGAAGPVAPAPVSDLVAFAHVADVRRSLAFYRLLGFDATATHEVNGTLVWAALACRDAKLMLAQADAPVDPGADAVFFYLYAPDLRGLRDHLVAHGVGVGEIVDGTPGPREEMRVTDPDGYCLMVAKIDPTGASSTVWPVLHYDDAARGLRFLVEAFGFREALAVRDEEGDVVHAQLRWPHGGAVVLGSTKHTDGVHGDRRSGAGASYVATDDVDGVHANALRAGAEIVAAPHETAFGAGVPTRAFTARDPEGNLWTFGTYRGAPWRPAQAD